MKYFFLSLIVFFIMSCNIGDRNYNNNNQENEIGGISLRLNMTNAPEDVVSVEAILSRPGQNTLNMVLSINDTMATGTFYNILVGSWELTVNAKNENGQILYSGTTMVEITAGQTTSVNLQLNSLTGNLEIVVTWSDNENCVFGSAFEIEMFDGNPIIPSDESWNNATVTGPTVLQYNNVYYMWYTGRGDWSFQVGLATSIDGFEWQEYESNPVMSFGESGEFDDYHLRFIHVIRDENLFKMWYTGYHGEWNPYMNETYYSIGYAESTNGINWSKYEGNPILQVSPEAWDDLNIMVGSVIKQNSLYHMWYNGYSSYFPENLDNIQGNGISQIGYAVSADGIHWEKYEYGPVMTPGSFDFESHSIRVNDVKINPAGYYEMFYTGINDNTRAIGRAISTDGINWTKDTLNPLIINGEFEEWNDISVAGASFIRNGSDYQFWFTGNGGWSSNWNIGTSTGTLICE